jgi:hypothetical protein
MAVSLADEFVKVIPTAVVAAGTLAAGWGVTQRISARWDRVRKERELDLAAVTQFYATYGEFFVIWKIWTTFPPRDGKVLAPDEQRRQLVARAAAMEGSLEALLIKLAVERKLKDKDKSVLPRFREGLQCYVNPLRMRCPSELIEGKGRNPETGWRYREAHRRRPIRTVARDRRMQRSRTWLAELPSSPRGLRGAARETETQTW